MYNAPRHEGIFFNKFNTFIEQPRDAQTKKEKEILYACKRTVQQREIARITKSHFITRGTINDYTTQSQHSEQHTSQRKDGIPADQVDENYNTLKLASFETGLK